MISDSALLTCLDLSYHPRSTRHWHFSGVGKQFVEN